MSSTSCTEEEACAAALAWLGTSPARLRRLLGDGPAQQAWAAIVAGDHPGDPGGRLRALVHPALPERLARRCQTSGIAVRLRGTPEYPACLAEDVEAPAVVFSQGSIAALEARCRVAVVGTRGATTAGRDGAQAMGEVLARSGLVVVSGLAEGIDTAALTGAVSVDGAAPVAVIGTAHDACGTPAQQRLCRAIAERGVVLSEIPPGAASARWRFAVRNRIMAALARVVVVVECHTRGGVLHTVRAARRRGIPVAAVPGSVHSSASEGANALLVAGAHCVRHGPDVIDLLTRLGGWRPERVPGNHLSVPRASEEGLDPMSRNVLGALDHDPAGLDAIVLRSGASLAEVSLALERLTAAGLARPEAGFWCATTPGPRRGRRRAAPGPGPSPG